MKVNRFLLITIWLLALSGSAQQVTELHYQRVNLMNGRSSENKSITYGKDFMKIESSMDRHILPTKFIDTKNNLVIVAFGGRSRDCVIEQADFVYYLYSRIEKTGAKKLINGYNCEEYVNHATDGKKCCDKVYNTIGFHIWITNDIKADSAYGIYIAHALLPQMASFNFTGVIVQIEAPVSFGKDKEYWNLDSVVTGQELLTDFERPWLKFGVETVVILPEGTNSDGRVNDSKYTAESLQQQFMRMKNLAIKVTGFEKPKFKTGFVGFLLR